MSLIALVSSEVGAIGRKMVVKLSLKFSQITPIKNATMDSDNNYYNILHSELQNVSYHWGTTLRK